MSTKGDHPDIEELARDPNRFLTARLREYEDVAVFPGVRRGIYQADPAVFYRPGELLTTDADAVIAARDRANVRVDLEPAEDEGTRRLGVQRIRVSDHLDPPRITQQLRGVLPGGVGVGVNHVFTPAQIHRIGPGTDPLPADGVDEADAVGPSGDVGVVVTDTGFFDHYPDLSDTTLEELVDKFSLDRDIETVAGPSGVIASRAAGHGGFIGGIIQTHLPETPMSMQDGRSPDDGFMDEISVGTATLEGLDTDGMGVVNLSLGSYAHSHGDLVAFRRMIEAILEDHPDVLLVCAAGNDGSEDHWYPAAWAAQHRYADAVVSVGALDTTGAVPRMADFSNRGPWVTAWAPGVDIRSIYPTDVTYEYYDGTNVVGTLAFEGRAMWSGTSFAAPYAVASILAHAAETGSSPREAWADLRRDAGFVVFP